MLHKHNISLHRKFALNNSSSLLSTVFVFSTARAAERIAATVCSGRINTVFFTLLFRILFFPLRIQARSALSASVKSIQSASISFSSYLSVSEFVLCGWFPKFSIRVLQDKEAYNGWFLMFDFTFGQLYLVKLIVQLPQPLEHCFLDRVMCVFSSFIYTSILNGDCDETFHTHTISWQGTSLFLRQHWSLDCRLPDAEHSQRIAKGLDRSVLNEKT